MEVKRFDEPKNNFLKKIRNYATKKNIVLILMNALLGLERFWRTAQEVQSESRHCDIW